MRHPALTPLAPWVLLIPGFLSGRKAALADESPLAPFERLPGGEWHLDNSYQTFEWGAGRQSVGARSFSLVAGTARLVSEGF